MATPQSTQATPQRKQLTEIETTKRVLEKLGVPYETINYNTWPGDDARYLIKVDRKTHFYFTETGAFAREGK